MAKPRYVTTEDIVIPAGTELSASPSKVAYYSDHVDAAIEHGPNVSSTWRMDLEEGLDLGLIQEVDDEADEGEENDNAQED